MAQTGFTPIQIYFSTTASNLPLAANLTNGELAINSADGKLFYKDSGGTVQTIAWKTTPVSAGGTGLSTATAGAIPYGAGTSPLALLSLVANQKLFGNAAGTAPEFATGVKIINSTRSSTAANGNVAYTGVGFKPSLVLALMSSSGALGRWSIGGMDGTTSYSLYTNELGNTQTIATYAGAVTASGGSQLAAYSSFDVDGFTITWTKTGAPAADTYSLIFICFR
jgi:hypothetical protein